MTRSGADETQSDGGWKLRGRRYLFESRWFHLRQDALTLPNGDEIDYTLVEHPGWVMIVPLLDGGRVLVEQIYRHPLQRTVLECPSGGRDGEPAEVAARRELEEETGYRAKRFHHLGRFVVSAGISDEEMDLFLATGLSADGRVRRDPTEQMQISDLPFEDLYEQALRGEIENAATTLALILAWARFNELA